jgi:hypothetical protein
MDDVPLGDDDDDDDENDDAQTRTTSSTGSRETRLPVVLTWNSTSSECRHQPLPRHSSTRELGHRRRTTTDDDIIDVCDIYCTTRASSNAHDEQENDGNVSLIDCDAWGSGIVTR